MEPSLPWSLFILLDTHILATALLLLQQTTTTHRHTQTHTLCVVLTVSNVEDDAAAVRHEQTERLGGVTLQTESARTLNCAEDDTVHDRYEQQPDRRQTEGKAHM